MKCRSIRVVMCLLAGIVAGHGLRASNEGFVYRAVTRIQASEATLSWPLYPYLAGSQVWLDHSGSFTDAYLSFPSTQFIPMDDVDGYWSTYANYSRYDGLRFGYPEGRYTYGFQQPGGDWLEVEHDVTANLPGSDTPVITNYPALQDIAPGASFNIEWDTDQSFEDGVRMEAEIIHLRNDGVYPSVYRLSAIEEPAIVPGTGRIEIPAGVVEAGNRYQLMLRFAEADGFQQRTVSGAPWDFYTCVRAETQVLLGLNTDAPIEPRFAWQTLYDLGWNTSGKWFLASRPRFPVSKEILLLFAPADWATVPAEQVTASGPTGSGFEASIGAFLFYDPDETLWYAVRSHSVEFPLSGTYSVTYRSRSYVSEQIEVPGPLSAPCAVPSVSLDAEGKVTYLQWHYRNPETGRRLEATELEKLAQQSVIIHSRDGSLLFSADAVDAVARSVAITPAVPVSWNDVDVVSVTARFENGSRSISRYRVSHFGTPLHVYFPEGYPYGEWLFVPWLGWLADVSWPWVWSHSHGYVFFVGTGEGQVYAWMSSRGWVYFSNITYPFVYDYAIGDWVLL